MKLVYQIANLNVCFGVRVYTIMFCHLSDVVLFSSIVRYVCTVIVLLGLHLLSFLLFYCYSFSCIIIKQTLGLVELVIYIGRSRKFK